MINLKNMGLILLFTINVLADETTKIDLTSYDKSMDKFGYKMAIDKNKLMIKKADIEIEILAQEKKIYPVVTKIDVINKKLKELETICKDYHNDRKQIYKNMFDTLSAKYPNFKLKILDNYTQNIQIEKEELDKCIVSKSQEEDRLKEEKQKFFERQDILNLKRSKLQIKLNSIDKKLARTENEINPLKVDKATPIKRKTKDKQHRPRICLRGKLVIRSINSPYKVIGTVDEVVDVFDLGERCVLKIWNSKTKQNINVETILIESVTHRDVRTKGYISANPEYQRPCI